MNPNSPHQAFLCQKLIDIIDYSGVPLQLGALPLDQDGSISEKLYNGRGNNLDPLDLLTIYPLSDIEKELLTEKNTLLLATTSLIVVFVLKVFFKVPGKSCYLTF